MSRRSQSSSRWPAAPGAWSQYAVTRVGPKGGIASDILPMAGRVLKPGGAAPIKVSQGAGFPELVGAARRQLKSVRFIKPAGLAGKEPGDLSGGEWAAIGVG